MFKGVIQLQIENGLEELRAHKQTCPSSATYLSKVATAYFLSSISSHLKELLLSRLKKSKFYSIMADESTNISSKVEFSICGRWLESDGRVVEHFLGIVHVHEIDVSSLTQSLLSLIEVFVEMVCVV